jgi:putative FmdB family regulatory protein
MPKYRYQCSCGVQFEGRNPVAKHMEPKPCPDCGHDAARMMPDGVEGHFNQIANGPGPQNTGVHGFDLNVDRVIGQSAAQGKAFMEERSRQKREFIQRNGIDPKRVGKLPDGSYTENTPEEQAFALRANKINSRAMSTLRPETQRGGQ